MYLYRIVIICLFPLFAMAQEAGKFQPVKQSRSLTWDDSRKNYLFYQKNGRPWAKRYKTSATPKIVVDTVAIVAGWADITLPAESNAKRFGWRRVRPTDSSSIIPVVSQMLTDSTDSVYSYGVLLRENGAKLKIKSSGGPADTGLVALHILVR